jgi:hypothetical protein
MSEPTEGNPTPKDLLDYEFKAWEKTIDVQQHFNNIEMQIRNIAITVLAGVIGAAGVVLKDSAFSAAVIIFAGLIAWVAFFLMDRFWYHNLLYGSVKHAQEIEVRLQEKIPGIKLSTSIGNASPIHVFSKEIHTNSKMIIFYALIAFVMVLLIVAFVAFGFYKIVNP